MKQIWASGKKYDITSNRFWESYHENKMKRANCKEIVCLERLHIYVLLKTLKIKTARVSFPNNDDLL